MSILVVGTVALDSVETPFGSAKNVLGGSATYASLAASYFYTPIHLVGVVGNDFPESYRQILSHNGIDLAGLQQDRGGKTFAWAGRYHYDLNERDTLATHLNVLKTFEPVVPAGYEDSRIVCLGNLDPTHQRKVLEQVDKSEFIVCDTMNFWIERTHESLLRTLSMVDCLVVNESEARQLANEPNLVRAAAIIRQMGPQILVIKKAEHGAMLFADGVIFSAPAFPLEEIQDPTGAGDVFMGGFVGYLAQVGRFDDEALRSAVVYGSAMASFVIERFGPERILQLDETQIHQRLQAFRELAAIPAFDAVLSVAS